MEGLLLSWTHLILAVVLVIIALIGNLIEEEKSIISFFMYFGPTYAICLLSIYQEHITHYLLHLWNVMKARGSSGGGGSSSSSGGGGKVVGGEEKEQVSLPKSLVVELTELGNFEPGEEVDLERAATVNRGGGEVEEGGGGGEVVDAKAP